MDLDYFLKINNTYGTNNKKETSLYNIKNHVNNRFTDTIDYYRVKVNDIDKDLLIIRTSKQNEKTIKSRPDEDFNIGDYVLFDDSSWLVTSKDVCNQVYTTGTIQLCNYTLKFQSSDGTILSYPCITTNRIQGTGDKETSTLTLPDGRKKVVLPSDENTILLRNDRRMYVDLHPTNPRPYVITFVDTTVGNYGEKGLIELYMQEDQEENTGQRHDRPDLGICNYFEPATTPQLPGESTDLLASIIYSGTNIIRIGGSVKKFTATLKDQNGNQINMTPIWTIEPNNGLNISIVDGELRISCTNNDLDQTEITVTVKDEHSGFSTSVIMLLSSIF